MCPNPPLQRPAQTAKSEGFSLVSAIFLLVVLAALGAFMLSIYSSQQNNSSQDVQGARAYQAAKAGLEWGTYQILTLENGPALAAPYACPALMGTPAFLNTLAAFTVNVNCSLSTTTEGSNVIRTYQITATASKGVAPSADYVERQMLARISTCRIGAGTVAPCA